jgi:hypothetical protein
MTNERWKTFKELTLKARKESERLTKEFGTQVWCEFQWQLEDQWSNNEPVVFLINPYCPNLVTGCYTGEELLTGKYLYVNFKTEKVIR